MCFRLQGDDEVNSPPIICPLSRENEENLTGLPNPKAVIFGYKKLDKGR
jgi:hypothetical protein